MAKKFKRRRPHYLNVSFLKKECYTYGDSKPYAVVIERIKHGGKQRIKKIH